MDFHIFISETVLLFSGNRNILAVSGQTTTERKINSNAFKVKFVIGKDVIYPLILHRNFLEETKASIIFGTKISSVGNFLK